MEDQVQLSENILPQQKPAGIELKTPSLQVPLDYSNAKDALPLGDEILYSTMCICSVVFQSVGIGREERTTYTWASHIVMTARGFAFIQPDFSKSHSKQGLKDWWNLYISSKHSTSGTYSTPAELKYLEWWNIMQLKPFQKASAQMIVYPYTFSLARVDQENEEHAKDRCTQFILDFLPRIIEEKRKWLEQNQNNPQIKGLRRKFIEMSMRRMINFQRKFSAKVEKKKLKAGGKAEIPNPTEPTTPSPEKAEKDAPKKEKEGKLDFTKKTLIF